MKLEQHCNYRKERLSEEKIAGDNTTVQLYEQIGGSQIW